MQQGYIKLHRQLLEWEWYDDINTKVLFLHCLLRANHKEKKWQGHTVKKGSFITSYEKLSIETGLSQRQIRTALDKLKMTGEMTHKSTSQYSIISINNWDKFQQDDIQNDKPMTSKRQTSDKRATTNNNDKNDNNDNKAAPAPTRKEIEEYCNIIAKKIDIDEFIAYYDAVNWIEDGKPVIWKRKVLTFAKNYKPSETNKIKRNDMSADITAYLKRYK